MLHTAYVSVSIQVSNTPFYSLTVTNNQQCHSSVIKVSLNQAITAEATCASPALPWMMTYWFVFPITMRKKHHVFKASLILSLPPAPASFTNFAHFCS